MVLPRDSSPRPVFRAASSSPATARRPFVQLAHSRLQLIALRVLVFPVLTAARLSSLRVRHQNRLQGLFGSFRLRGPKHALSSKSRVS